MRRQFDRCALHIEKTLAAETVRTHSLEDMRHLLLRQEAQLWVLPNSALVTTVVKHPQAKVLTHWIGGGSLEELIAVEPNIEMFARDEGCNAILINGRRGWGRVLNGYTETHTVYAKVIDHG